MLRILHLEDRNEDAALIEHTLAGQGVPALIRVVDDRRKFSAALEAEPFDLILADNGLPGFSCLEALHLARQKFPEIGFLCVSGATAAEEARKILASGADAFVLKDYPWQLVAAVRSEVEKLRLRRIHLARARLVTAIQELSLARDLNGIMAVVRRAARELTGADGATFVLREGELCHYADEDAISPLWKGQRFPLTACISGWAMLNRQSAVIEDIYADSRIPADAYRATFVKSLAMVPIRTEDPIGAIGNYWAHRRLPPPEDVELLQTLANATAVAMENVRICGELEARVRTRTAQLEIVNRELESFSYAVSHDLGAPLRSIQQFAQLALEEFSNGAGPNTENFLQRILASGKRMRELIDDLLRLSKIARTDLKKQFVNLSEMARSIAARIDPDGKAAFHVADGLGAEGDPGLLRIVLENLLSNAWKYTAKRPEPQINFTTEPQPDGTLAFCVRDNGVGFDMNRAAHLFKPFQRLHSQEDFPGSGIGLTTVQRVLERHGGRIWAQARINEGAAFFFTLA